MTVTEQGNNRRAGESLPPAYFLSLTVANFRCFGKEPQTLDLSDGNGKPAQWTVLLGENGVGKTTLLQLLVAASPRFDPEPKLVGTAKDTQGVYEPSLFSRLARSGYFDDIDNAMDSRVGLSVDLLVASKDGRIREIEGDPYQFGFEVISEHHHGFTMYRESRFKLTENLLCAYGASRRMSRKALPERLGDDSCESLFLDNAELLNAEDWLITTDYAVKAGKPGQQRRARIRMEAVKSLLTHVLPDVSDFSFGASDDTRMTPRVEAKTPYGWVRVSDLSYGYKTALTWMVDLASRLFDRYPNSENPLAEPAVVLVDEIDLHLHPKWQRDLVQKLTETFPNTQFIVTAHSPLIVQAAPNANLALLRREGDHVVIDNDVDEIRNWRVDQILTSDLFGLKTARPPQVAVVLEERRQILSQQTISEADHQRLAELEKVVDNLSVGETPADLRAQDALHRAVALLKRDAGK